MKPIDLYDPSYSPPDTDLVRPLERDTTSEVEQRVDRRIQQSQDERQAGTKTLEDVVSARGGSRAPLSFEEATLVEERKDELIAELRIARARIQQIQQQISAYLYGDGTPFEFAVDVENKARVRRALQRAFGLKNPTTITYEMYVAALRARRELESSEARKYTSGEWSEE
jgi:hypothetical protein